MGIGPKNTQLFPATKGLIHPVGGGGPFLGRFRRDGTGHGGALGYRVRKTIGGGRGPIKPAKKKKKNTGSGGDISPEPKLGGTRGVFFPVGGGWVWKTFGAHRGGHVIQPYRQKTWILFRGKAHHGDWVAEGKFWGKRKGGGGKGAGGEWEKKDGWGRPVQSEGSNPPDPGGGAGGGLLRGRHDFYGTPEEGGGGGAGPS